MDTERSQVNRYLSLFSSREKYIFILVALAQLLLGAMDLIGVALIGAVGALALRVVQGIPAGDRVQTTLEVFNLDKFSGETQVQILAISAALFLLFKTFASMWTSKKILSFVGRRSVSLSNEVMSNVFNGHHEDFNNFEESEIVYYTTDGIENITVGIIGTALALASDVALLVVIGVGLLLVDPAITLSIIFLFGFSTFLLLFLIKTKTQNVGSELALSGIKSSTFVLQSWRNFVQIYALNRIHPMVKKFEAIRLSNTKLTVDKAFLPLVSKYIVEGTMVVGVMGVTLLQFISSSPERAVGSLALFVAAVARISPAVMRIQQGSILIRSNAAAADRTLNFIDLAAESFTRNLRNSITGANMPKPSIAIDNVTYKYDSDSAFQLATGKVQIPFGSFVGIVGPSGGGKSTLIKLILGLLKPKAGTIEVGGVSPRDYISSGNGKMAYVPQVPTSIEGTIKENIFFGSASDTWPEDKVWKVLDSVGLGDYVRSLDLSLNTNLGPGNLILSGGQLQRLNIARALIGDPLILILDEPTSALDKVSEEAIKVAISNLHGQCSVIMVAHKESVLQGIDLELRVSKGRMEVVS